jgi:hypothetical protein
MFLFLVDIDHYRLFAYYLWFVIKYVSSEFKVSLLAVNHLFLTVNMWFDNSTRWLTACSENQCMLHKCGL